MSYHPLMTDAELELLQRESFEYFLHEANSINGLILDKTAPDWPTSITATDLALAAYPIAIERGFISRDKAIERTGLLWEMMRHCPYFIKGLKRAGFSGGYL